MILVVLVTQSLLDFSSVLNSSHVLNFVWHKDSSQDNESLLMCLGVSYSALRNVLSSSDSFFFFPWNAVARQDVIVHVYQSALPLAPASLSLSVSLSPFHMVMENTLKKTSLKAW